jgi:hypothetical protein
MNDDLALADRIAATTDALFEACQSLGVLITGDGRVAVPVAAQLLCVAEQTLANGRALGKGPPSYSRAGGGSRVTYRLRDLAAWLEAGRMDN